MLTSLTAALQQVSEQITKKYLTFLETAKNFSIKEKAQLWLERQRWQGFLQIRELLARGMHR